MQRNLVYKEPIEVMNKLSTIFDVSSDELRSIALEAAGARNSATSLHPVNAGGTYSYMEGVAALRMIFTAKRGWVAARPNGVEAVVNRARGLMIIFQNVDRACGIHDPVPISSKGEGSMKLVDKPTRYLFPEHELEALSRENKQVWFLCVSSQGDQVNAELSRPRAIESGSFSTFAERIFVLQHSDLVVKDDLDKSSPVLVSDSDIPVTKKA